MKNMVLFCSVLLTLMSVPLSAGPNGLQVIYAFVPTDSVGATENGILQLNVILSDSSWSGAVEIEPMDAQALLTIASIQIPHVSFLQPATATRQYSRPLADHADVLLWKVSIPAIAGTPEELVVVGMPMKGAN